MRKLAIALCSVMAMSASASAADLPVKAPRQVAAPAFSWTGFYIGANVGYAWGDTTGTAFTPPGNFEISGPLAGGQVGVNYQVNNFVFGIEADYQWASIDGNGALLGGFVDHAEVRRFGTVRGRLGFAWDRFMLYGTGGWTYGARLEANTAAPGIVFADNRSLSGWNAGVGLEYAFAPAWSLKLEYLHVNLDERTYFGAFGCAPVAACQLGADIDLIRVGVNYRFGGAPFGRP